jgi:hypothetical protein
MADIVITAARIAEGVLAISEAAKCFPTSLSHLGVEPEEEGYGWKDVDPADVAAVLAYLRSRSKHHIRLDSATYLEDLAVWCERRGMGYGFHEWQPLWPIVAAAVYFGYVMMGANGSLFAAPSPEKTTFKSRKYDSLTDMELENCGDREAIKLLHRRRHRKRLEEEALLEHDVEEDDEVII